MNVLHFPVGGRAPGGKHRDSLQQPGPPGQHPLRERYREAGKAGFSCPGCGATTADLDLIRIGYCGACLRPTGLCPVGRDISLSGIALDMGELCSDYGVALWDFDGIGRRLVCRLHDLELAGRRYVWIHGTRVGP